MKTSTRRIARFFRGWSDEIWQLSARQLVRTVFLLSFFSNSNRFPRAIGTLGRWASPLGADNAFLKEEDAAGLGTILRTSPAAREVITGTIVFENSLADLLSVSSRPSLRVPVAQAIVRRRGDAAGRARFLYESIALSGPELSQDERATALIAGTLLANEFLEQQAKSIMQNCLLLINLPLDPYQPTGLNGFNRRMVAALVSEHPSLDEVIFENLPADGRNAALSAFAAGLAKRPKNRALAMQKLFHEWNPTADQARWFCQESDSTFETGREQGRMTSTRAGAWKPHAFPMGRKWAAHLVVPVVGAVVLGLSWRFNWANAPLSPSLGLAIAGLALVALIHVVSAQLAATRLAGVLARYSVSSLSLTVSYWATAVLALVSISVSSKRVADALAWVGTVTVIMLVPAVVAAAWALIRQTDPAFAVASFAMRRNGVFQRVGRKWGSVQAESESFRGEIARLQFIRLTTVPSQVARRVTIVAGHRGIYLPDRRKLVRVQREQSWRDGHLKTELLSQLGKIVSEGEELAVIIPDVASVVPRREARRVTRCLRPRGSQWAEAASESATLIVGVISKLAQAGDIGGAERSMDALLKLVRVTLEAAKRERLKKHQLDNQLFPMHPVVTSVVRALLQQIEEALVESERECLCAALTGLVELADQANGIVINACSKLERLKSSSAVTGIDLANIIREMGAVAARHDDTIALGMVQRTAGSLMTARDRDPLSWHLFEASAEVAALCPWTNGGLSLRCWRQFWSDVPTYATQGWRVVAAGKVGAANLLAGSTSTALEVAMDLKSVIADSTQIEEQLTKRDLVSREASISEFGGGYLGENPEEAIRDFVKFFAACTALA